MTAPSSNSSIMRRRWARSRFTLGRIILISLRGGLASFVSNYSHMFEIKHNKVFAVPKSLTSDINCLFVNTIDDSDDTEIEEEKKEIQQDEYMKESLDILSDYIKMQKK